MNSDNMHLSINELEKRINRYKNYQPVNEMVKVRAALDEDSIIWEDRSDERVAETHITIGNREISVINGIGTDGGEDLFTGDNEGLLEAWSNSGEDPIGRLTASDVMLIVYNTIYREKLKAVDKKR